MTYQRRFTTLTATLSLATVCAVLTPTRAQASCGATTIAGNYGFRLHELVGSGSMPAPSSGILLSLGQFSWGAFAGQMVFDPSTGTVTGFRTGNEGGAPLTNSFTSQSTYSVNSDCTGTLTLVLDDGSSRAYQIAIVQGGAEIELAEEIGSSLLVVADGVARKQPATCDATTIAGDFGIRFNRLLAPSANETTSALGSFIPNDFAGLIHFDPTTSPPSVSGHLTGITGGSFKYNTTVHEPDSYSVSPNCTGTLIFTTTTAAGTETKTLEMVIVQDGASFDIELAFVSTTVIPTVGEGVAKKQ
jgi:hypothetical protein